MSDRSDATDSPDDADAPSATDAAATPDDSVTSSDESAPSGPPKPRPATSAASRARRIGGGTTPLAPRPAPVASGADDKTVRLGKAAGADEPTVSLGKGGDKAASKAASKEAKGASTEAKAGGRPTLAVPAWLAWAPAVAFFVVAAVFLALLLVNRLGGDDSSTTSTKERQQVLAAAKECVAATNTYKYTAIDKYEAAGLKCTTGTYSKQYSNAMNTLIKKNAPTQKFTQVAKINSAGVEAVTKNGKQWSVLVYGQLNITNAALGKAGRVDPFGLVVTMAQDKGNWVIAQIRLLSSVN